MTTHRAVRLGRLCLAASLLTSGCASYGPPPASDRSRILAPTTAGARPVPSGRYQPGLDVEGLVRDATAQYRAGDGAAAERSFQEALRRSPGHPRATYNLAMIYLQRAYDGLHRYHLQRDANTPHDRRVESLLRDLSNFVGTP